MNIKEKIQKIIAKAKSTDSEAEAATFLAKAEALMEAHQLGILDLGEDDPMGQWDAFEATASNPTWKNHVLNAVALHFGARVVRSWVTSKKFKFTVNGPESARVTVELMYPFIIEQIRAEGRKAAKEMGLKPEAAIRRVGNALCHKMSATRAEQQKLDGANNQPRTAAAAKNALVKVDALQAYMDEQYSNLGTSRGRGTSSNATAKRAAGNVSLHRQTGGSATLKLR